MSTDDKKESQLSMVQLGDGGAFQALRTYEAHTRQYICVPALDTIHNVGPMVSTLCLGTMTWGSQMTDEVIILFSLCSFSLSLPLSVSLFLCLFLSFSVSF